MEITGEPADKLNLFGHTSTSIRHHQPPQILVFGGFGGHGRHARRNDILFLDPLSGLLRQVDPASDRRPSPRIGHTASVVGDRCFVVGGRAGPNEILDEVWVLDVVDLRWTLARCSGDAFPPRHRHAAVVVGSNIYVFGGLNNEFIYSSMHILDTNTLHWYEVNTSGEYPPARHSHSLVAVDSHLFIFGGYDGKRALGDFYSFNIHSFSFTKEQTKGILPLPRFSHSTFVYKDYLGLIGGCPLRQDPQEIALFNFVSRVWEHVNIGTIGRKLWIRCSVNVIDDDLLVLGGGLSCYAFGTKFDPPIKISLIPLIAKTFYDNKQVTLYYQPPVNMNNDVQFVEGLGQKMEPKDVMFQLEKKFAKLGKDILKRFGWLNLRRKVETNENGHHILFPVTHAFFCQRSLYLAEKTERKDALDPVECFAMNGLIVNEISLPKAMDLLLSYGVLIGKKSNEKRIPKSPRMLLHDMIGSLIDRKGISRQLLEQLPTRWERLGDIVVLPGTSFKDPIWDSIAEELWPAVAKSLGANRLARQGRVSYTGTRDSTLEILLGDSGWVNHHENGIIYSFDARKCMFSSGNLSEKRRMANLDCRNEIVVDLFAGIGYFVLPFLVKSKAKLVYACEWNPYAVEALRCNVQANSVAERCVILEGDNRITAPKRIAHRICLGLLPTSEASWLTAVQALKTEGGMLHIHGNVNDVDEQSWSEYVVKSIQNMSRSEGYSWDVSVQHLERVKWYGPHIRHLVADVRCQQQC